MHTDKVKGNLISRTFRKYTELQEKTVAVRNVAHFGDLKAV